jgi:cobalamin synthase
MIAVDQLDEFRACLAFFSRLPLSPTEGRFPRALRLAPLAGALLGVFSALPFLLALHWGEPPLVAALLGVAGAAALTGALHEDGLADVADGFGGGATRERKLEIMRDSRIGAYGATALMLSLGLRAACLAALASSPGRAVLILAAAGAISRLACLAPDRRQAFFRGLSRACHWPWLWSWRFCHGLTAPVLAPASRRRFSPASRYGRFAPWRGRRSADRPAMSPARRNRSRKSPSCWSLPERRRDPEIHALRRDMPDRSEVRTVRGMPEDAGRNRGLEKHGRSGAAEPHARTAVTTGSGGVSSGRY